MKKIDKLFSIWNVYWYSSLGWLTFSWNIEDLEKVGSQHCLTIFFALIHQKEHDVLEDVKLTYDHFNLSISSLNEKEILSRDEENCRIL